MPQESRVDREPWYEFTAQTDGGTSAELRIFGPIGGGFWEDEDAPTGKLIAQQLDAIPDSVKTLNVRVTSGGGSVFEAIHIANVLKRQRDEFGRNVVVDIEALAASAATIITSAGAPIRIPSNALMMVHNPAVVASGDHRVMSRLSKTLAQIKTAIVATYRWVSSLSSEALSDLMDGDDGADGTWMNAEDAVANGFATEITNAVEATASLSADHLEHLGTLPDEFRDRITALVKSNKREVKMAKTKTTAAGTTTTMATGPMDADALTTPDPSVAEAATRDERARIVAITGAQRIAESAGVPAPVALQIVKDGIKNSETVDEVREKFFAALQSGANAVGPIAGPTGAIEITDDERDKRRRGICAGLWARSGVTDLFRQAAAKRPLDPTFQNLELDPGEFRGMSLVDHARHTLERDDPGSTAGKLKMDIAGMFFNAAGGSGGYQTTADFAVALEEALNKLLLAAYAIAPDKWRLFCSVGSVNDFRLHNRYRRGFLSRLDKVLETGEFVNKALADATKETQQAETFGNILALSRVAMVNDDMGFLNTAATDLGRAAALSIELEVFDALLENGGLGPDMNDGNPLFDASHNNLGAGAAISVAQLDENRVVMASQTDPSGNEVLDLRPSVLLIPIGLGGTARVINESQFDTTASQNFHIPNKVAGLFSTIVDTSRITGTRQYLFADPATAPTFEVAFLEGQQTPVMEMQDGWRVDGVEWKIRHDFGVAAVDFRGAVTDAGA